jgi:hypothetical protein
MLLFLQKLARRFLVFPLARRVTVIHLLMTVGNVGLSYIARHRWVLDSRDSLPGGPTLGRGPKAKLQISLGLIQLLCVDRSAGQIVENRIPRVSLNGKHGLCSIQVVLDYKTSLLTEGFG